MKSVLALVAVALLGLFGATSIGYAAYVVSRDSVGLPVTKLDFSPNDLAPPATTTTKAKPRTTSTATTRTTPRTTTSDDHDSSNSGKGSGSSGSGKDGEPDHDDD